MARWYLLIIVVGVIVGAMLPSGPPTDRPVPDVGATSLAETRIVEARRSDNYSASAASAPAPVSGQGVTLDRAADGHFYADAQVNGMSVRFLVDTGASGVALSAIDAQRVGLPFLSSQFSAVGRGASGEVRGKLVTLDRVTLGGKSVDNVSGAILEGSDMSLLGQSFLGRMGTIEISGDRMVIR